MQSNHSCLKNKAEKQTFLLWDQIFFFKENMRATATTIRSLLY